MNPNTNEIRMFHDEIPEAFKEKGWKPLPTDLQRAAKKALKGKKSVVISKNSGGKLSRWAAGQRQKDKLKNKQKEMVNKCNNYYDGK